MNVTDRLGTQWELWYKSKFFLGDESWVVVTEVDDPIVQAFILDANMREMHLVSPNLLMTVTYQKNPIGSFARYTTQVKK